MSTDGNNSVGAGARPLAASMDKDSTLRQRLGAQRADLEERLADVTSRFNDGVAENEALKELRGEQDGIEKELKVVKKDIVDVECSDCLKSTATTIGVVGGAILCCMCFCPK